MIPATRQSIEMALNTTNVRYCGEFKKLIGMCKLTPPQIGIVLRDMKRSVEHLFVADDVALLNTTSPDVKRAIYRQLLAANRVNVTEDDLKAHFTETLMGC